MFRLKTLRKYNQSILVVGGTLLMIAWLLPGTLNKIGHSTGGKSIAKIDGRTLSASAWERDRSELRIVESTLFGDMAGATTRDLMGIEGPEHWEMLVREAKAGGYIGGSAQVDALIDGLAAQIAQSQIRRMPQQNQTQEILDQFMGLVRDGMHKRREELMARIGPRAVDDALSKMAGIAMMKTAYLGASRVSEPQARVDGHDLLDQADVDFIVVLAADQAKDAPEPDDAALRAQFEKHKNEAPGTGETGFGYLRPAAVQMEWLTLSRQQVADAVSLDPIEVNKRWKGARDKYTGEFAAEKARVETDMKNDAVAQAFREADQIVRQEIAQEQRKYPDQDGKKAVPANWRETTKPLAVLSGTVGDKLGASLGKRVDPAIGAREGWVSAQELAGMPSLIGRAQIPIGARTVSLADAYPEIREIGGKDARGPQVGLLTGPAIDPQGNYHYFRLTAARPEGPPASLDEVRAEVVSDVKRIQTYERLTARLDEIRAKTLRSGVAGVHDMFPDAESPQPASVSHLASSLHPNAVNTPELRAKVMEAYAKLNPTKAVGEAPMEDRVVVVASPRALAVVAMEIKGLRALTVEDTELNLLAFPTYAQRQRSDGNIDDPYSWERIKERHGYVELGNRKFLEGEEAKADAAAKKPAEGGSTEKDAPKKPAS